jgi:hypothetical protein
MISRYTWQDSAINALDFSTNLSGNPEAAIHVSASARPEQLADLRKSLSDNGISSYLDTKGDSTVLKVVGYGSEESLLATLSRQSLTHGPGQKEIVNEEGKKGGIFQKIRENGTNIAGALGMLGHAALIRSGQIAHEKERVMAGIQYGTSAGILAVYGSGHEEKIAKLCAGLREHLAHEGLAFSASSSLTPLEAYRQRNMLQKGHDAFRANSILAANLIGVGGNFSMLKSGYDLAKREGVMMGLGRAAHGGINLAGAGVASFVDEKDKEQIEAEKQRREGKPKGLLGSAKDLISRAPLAFQGSIFLLDNIATNYDAYKIRERYFQRQSKDVVPLPPMPEGVQEGSKEHKAWKKAYEAALHEAGHMQRLDENWKKLTGMLEKIPGSQALKEQLSVASHSIPSMEECLSKVKTIESTVRHNEALKGLLAERKLLLQELEEVQKYPRGWILAAVKAGAWTLSSAFQAVALKNREATPDQKYSELAAQVATMVLEIAPEQREAAIQKSAEYLSASKDFVHVRSDDLAKRIHAKIDAISKSPWAAVMKGMETPVPEAQVASSAAFAAPEVPGTVVGAAQPMETRAVAASEPVRAAG